MLSQYTLTTATDGFTNITATVEQALKQSGVQDGLCVVYCPHTTAGVTINENADPDVVRDMLLGLSRAFPDRPEFRHAEGNSPAHLKASAIGSSVTVIVKDSRLLLGAWQGIYFCEFDGPRGRRFFVKIIEG
jgi:secondary thiamine-phosphate synthase enzyme